MKPNHNEKRVIPEGFNSGSDKRALDIAMQMAKKDREGFATSSDQFKQFLHLIWQDVRINLQQCWNLILRPILKLWLKVLQICVLAGAIVLLEYLYISWQKGETELPLNVWIVLIILMICILYMLWKYLRDYVKEKWEEAKRKAQ